MKYYVGMDVGATNMRIQIAGESGEPVLLHESAGGAINASGYDYVEKIYKEGLTDALEKADLKPEDCLCLCGGICGIDSPELRETYTQFVMNAGFSRDVLRMYNDCEVLLHLDESTNMLAVVAGTGSIVMGRTPAGNEARFGGRGQLLGDDGGAFYIVKEAFVRMIRYLDGYGDCELLCRLFAEETGMDTPIAIKSFYQENCITKKSLISQYAPLVTKAAEGGDPGALEVMEASAQGLYLAVCAVAEKLHLSPDAPLQVLYWGSVLENVPLIANRLTSLITARFPHAQTVFSEESAVDIALHIAMRNKK